jgi:DNA repair protein SbcD/Mre11
LDNPKRSSIMKGIMRILHTADWHLGDRLGRIDRTDDLRRAVERVARYCRQHDVDVLLVAGDLFSELARPDSLREAIEHCQAVFREFLQHAGTILTLTGNHDNETFCQTLNHIMGLAAPLPDELGALVPRGRLYLATEPTLLRLADRKQGFEVQFVLMPYPTPARYLKGEANQRYASPEEKNRKLEAAFAAALQGIQQHERYDSRLPAVLSAHINLRGTAVGPALFRISELEDVVIEGVGLVEPFTYVALGHIHKPHYLAGKPHVRYSGSVERLDLGEKGDAKSVALVDIGPSGLVGEPTLLPMEATAIYEIDVRQPSDEIPRLKERYADAQEDLVNIHLVYTAGVDNLEESLRRLEEVFPRWYSRDWHEASALGASLVGGAEEAARSKSFAETVREYVSGELAHHPEVERSAVFERLEALFREADE